jgi:hypothetical protein
MRDAGVTFLAALVLVLANVAYVAGGLGAPPHRPRQVKELDHYRYLAMAEAPPGQAPDPAARERPFSRRVLAPALVYGATRLGAGIHAAFWALFVFASTAFLFLLGRFLRALGFDAALSLAGMTLAALTPGAVRWYAYQYWMPDPLCQALVVLGLLLALRGRDAALAAVSIAGVVTRETYVIVPLWAALHFCRVDGVRAGLRRSALVFAPAAVALVALYVVVPAQGGPTLLEAAREMLAFRARHLFDGQLYFVTLGTFGALLPLLLVRLPRAARALRDRPEDAVLAVVVVASLAVANNTDRLLVYALPVLLPPGLRALGAFGEVVGRGAAFATVAAVQAAFYVLTPGWGTPGLSLYRPANVWVIGACVVLTLALVSAARRTSYSS